MENKFCRFLIVNEDSIRDSELFTDCLELKNIALLHLYKEIKRKHAGILFMLHYAEDLLRKESESIPAKIVKAEEELDIMGNEHVKLIVQIGKKNNVSDEFLKMVVKMYATYELEVCSQVEFSILEGVFNSIEKVRPSLNDDLKVLLESYKKVYELEGTLAAKREFKDKVNDCLRNIRLLHKYYIFTAGFDERYIKKDYKQTVEKIYDTLNNMFNLLCISGKNISVLAIIDALKKYEIEQYTCHFARIEYAKNFRVHGDGKYLEDFIQYINHGVVSRLQIKEENVLEEYIEATLKEKSGLLEKYAQILRRWKKAGVSLSIELDIESELKKVNGILEQYYEKKTIQERIDYVYAGYNFAKEMQMKMVDKFDKTSDSETDAKQVLRCLSEEEEKEYFKKLRELQITKVKKIADEIVMMEKQADFISEYYLKAQGIKTKELLELFTKVDDKVSAVYKSYVSPQIYRATSAVSKHKRMSKGLPVEKVEELYSLLFSAAPDGVDLDERVDKKNHFYVCNFNPEIGVMTFPYANISSGVQKCKYSRAAILYDMCIHDKIVCENRGASWASDPDERSKKKINGKETKVYTGNKLVINNKTHGLQEFISRAIFTTKDDKEEIGSGKIPYLGSHKFDYRKGMLTLNFPSVVGAHERYSYYGVDDIVWISGDNVDISEYKAMCYADTADKLKEIIEKL